MVKFYMHVARVYEYYQQLDVQRMPRDARMQVQFCTRGMYFTPQKVYVHRV